VQAGDCPGDHQSLDLLRPINDSEDLVNAVPALHRVMGEVVSTEDLDGLFGDPHCDLIGHELVGTGSNP